jgi:hypothetical protein
MRSLRIAPDHIDSMCDIQVDAKVEQVLLIFANSRGHEVVEELWPDVEGTTDDIFASAHSPDWAVSTYSGDQVPAAP